MRVRRLFLGIVAALISSGCGGGETTGAVAVTPTPAVVVTSVAVSPGFVSMELGGTATLAADARSQSGAVVPGKTPVWTSSNATAVAVDASGGLRALAVGTATITATIDGKSGSAVISVTPATIASVTIAPPAGPLTAGQTATLVATPKDKDGTALTGRFFNWTTSSTRIATVDNAGVVTAVSPGSVTITALSEGVSGVVTVIVAAPAGSQLPVITSVSPAALTPGGTATISGTNFIAGAASNVVYVAGILAPVQAATATQITIAIPVVGLPCQSTQPVSVEVTSLGGTGTFRHPLAIATTRSLAVGASYMTTPNGTVGCTELPAGGTYLISIFNAATTPTSIVGFELRGSVGGIVLQAATPSLASRTIDLSAPAAPRRSRVDAAALAAAREHLDHLEQGRDLVRRLGPARSYGRASRLAVPGAASLSTAPVPLVVGQTATVNYNYNTCRTAASPVITARVVYVGAKVIVLEDNASVLAGKIDADMVNLAKEFEDVSYPILLNFGDPLAYDAQTDNNGHIIVLFTPRVNNQAANLLGFVQSCDFYKTTDDPSVNASNMAEIFYARAVTDTSATSTSLNGRPQWKRLMPSTLVHETKHIIANAERNATPILTRNEETWLEEGTAQLASEMFGRALHGNSWRSNSAYFGVIDCEVRPNNPTCNGASFIMGNHFGFLSDYLEDFENKSILGGGGDITIYGSSWMFARWLVDTYGGSNEGAFLKKLIFSFEKFGVDNVTAASGKTWPELLSQFTLMLAVDDMNGISTPFTEQSWNLPAIFAGYHSDFPSRSPLVPLSPRTTTLGTAFSASSNSLRGGAAVLLRLTPGGSTPQMLELKGVANTALATGSTVGMAVLRIQ